ncbi:LysR family transcriptional regulator [Actinoplanes sp. CA-142083]|uniref:LysR family transcriptional regulator n=1 Tax=Actinoplanes sp. CA-142083 TaxID=3239903 RepID=UPI003D9208AA
MDLFRHLRYFLVVAEELHVSRAAEVLGMAQPPLSQAIRRLERELAVELFARQPRGIALTPAGQALRDEAVTLLAAEQRMRTLLHTIRDGGLGVLRAGVPADTPAPVLGALLDRLAAEAPGLDIDLQELTTAEQLDALQGARLDVGLVHHPVDLTELCSGPATHTPLGVVLPRTSPLARAAELSFGDLAGQALVLFPRSGAPDWYDQILAIAAGRGFRPTRVRHARSPELLFGMLLAGHGAGLERASVARREPRVVWRPIEGEPLTQRISAVWPRRGPHPAASRFAELATEVLTATDPARSPLPGPAQAPSPWSVVFDTARDHG